AREVQGRLHLGALLSGRIELSPLQAKTLTLEIFEGKPPARERATLPFGIAIAEVSIDQLQITRGEAHYRLEDVKLAKADFGARGLDASGSFRYPHERFQVSAQAEVRGALDALRIALKWQAA